MRHLQWQTLILSKKSYVLSFTSVSDKPTAKGDVQLHPNDILFFIIEGTNLITNRNFQDSSLEPLLDIAYRLDCLRLRRCPNLSDKGLKYIADNFPYLVFLSVGCYIDIVGFVTRNKITNAGLKHLSNMKQLLWLDLGGLDINDEGIENLGKMEQLYRLGIEKTKVTDASVDIIIKNFPNLESLDVRETLISAAGVARLEANRISVSWKEK